MSGNFENRSLDSSGNSDSDEANLPLPRVMDLHGRAVDPTTGKVLHGGQEHPDSIFYIPKNDSAEGGYRIGEEKETLPDLMKKLRKAGFRGEQIVLAITPYPEDENRVPIPPPQKSFGASSSSELYEVAGGNPYRTNCGYCWATIQLRERPRGFTLEELRESANAGCETCNMVQKSVSHFAGAIFNKYDPLQMRIQQKDKSLAGRTGLLAQTNSVHVFFDEYGGERVELDFRKQDQTINQGSYEHGRISDTGSWGAAKLIQGWIDTCNTEHAECASVSLVSLPMRVLEVSNRCARVVETNGKVATYLTLSHCWGKKKMACLTSANLSTFKVEIPWSIISRTFRDAISLCYRLGFRYLWIDSLCILQDSKSDWEYHASVMANIYTRSQLTISASRADSGEQGLFSVRAEDPMRLLQSDLRLLYNPALWKPYMVSGKDRDGCFKEFVVQMKRPHGLYEMKKPKEPLLKRSWVFQEQILSPRIIHFASGELYYECKSHTACECRGWMPKTDMAQWETRWRKAHATILSSHDDEIDPKVKSRLDFEAYRCLVESYSELNITYDLDRLPALSGVNSGRDDNYVAGMWETILQECLHWRPHNPGTSGTMARRSHEWRAPTWSWVSMECPIRHVEHTFGKYHHSARPVARVIAVSCTPVGVDPRGRIVEGYLKLAAPLAEACVVDIGLCERPDRSPMNKDIRTHYTRHIEPSMDEWGDAEPLCTYATLAQDSMCGTCFLDVPFVACRSNPAEVEVGSSVTLLLLSTTTILVLKNASSDGSYFRVGYFQPQETGWKFKAQFENAVIL